MATNLKVIAVLGIVFLAISVAMAALAVGYERSASRARRGLQAPATVVASQHGSMVAQPGFVRVRFVTASGTTVETAINTSINPRLRPGDEVSVRYDPADPETARLVEGGAGRNENAVGKLVVGAVASLLIGLLLVATTRSERLQEVLKVPTTTTPHSP